MRRMLAAVLCSSWLAALATAQDPANERRAGRAEDVPLGSVVDATFTDLRWQPRRLAEFGDVPATVLFFATIDCPLVQRYLPRFGRLARSYEDRGVVFVVVHVGAGDPMVDAIGQVTEAAPAAVFAKDFDLALARAAGVDRTGAAVVLDRQRRLVYRGRIDDQHGYSASRTAASREDLQLAIDDALAGRAVAVAETAYQGCRITPPAPPPAPAAAPTFHRDVLPILQQRCQDCHRPGGEAPFALLDERDARKHAAMIVEVVEQGRMPPWYGASQQAAGAAHEFVNRRAMPADERDRLRAWFAAGMPSGDPAQAPPPRALPTGEWRIGEPDLVIEIKSPIRLPADGVVPYKYFILPHRFREDTWVEAIEIKPENGRSLHHCNLARVKFGEQFSQEGFVTGYVPGGDPMVLDPGTAVRMPAGSVLALQAHYVTTGTEEVDRLRVGLRFPRVRVQKELQVAIAADFRFEIPPGARAHPVKASRKLPADAIGIGMFVHMHLRGRDMSVVAEVPGGREEKLLLVPNYNFEWQQSYRWEAGARRFPAGTRIRALAHFDNSVFNPFNPDPGVPVRFGEETTDEMMYLFLFWVAEQEALGLDVDAKTGHVVAAGDGGQR
jgi:thiol-disulfide isomerase/thioredoxin/mono/diheme cytochrome c family protein